LKHLTFISISHQPTSGIIAKINCLLHFHHSLYALINLAYTLVGEAEKILRKTLSNIYRTHPHHGNSFHNYFPIEKVTEWYIMTEKYILLEGVLMAKLGIQQRDITQIHVSGRLFSQ